MTLNRGIFINTVDSRVITMQKAITLDSIQKYLNKHPNPYLLAGQLFKEEFEEGTVKALSVEVDAEEARIRRSTKKVKAKRKTLIKKLDRGSITVPNFMKAIGQSVIKKDERMARMITKAIEDGEYDNDLLDQVINRNSTDSDENHDDPVKKCRRKSTGKKRK